MERPVRPQEPSAEGRWRARACSHPRARIVSTARQAAAEKAAAKAAEEAEKLRSELAQGKAKRDELQEKLNAAERASRDGRCAQARQIWGRWGWGVGEGGT